MNQNVSKGRPPIISQRLEDVFKLMVLNKIVKGKLIATLLQVIENTDTVGKHRFSLCYEISWYFCYETPGDFITEVKCYEISWYSKTRSRHKQKCGGTGKLKQPT